MGELIRHSKELITTPTGKPFRANDPEEYIKRLHHFAVGLGFNPEHLTGGVNPAFTGKQVNVSRHNIEPTNRLSGIDHSFVDYRFDEGLISGGLLSAAMPTISQRRDTDSWADDSVYAFNEIHHREPMYIGITSYHDRDTPEYAKHELSIGKSVNLHQRREHPGEGRRIEISSRHTDSGISVPIDALQSSSKNHINFVADTFREKNRSRSVNPRGLAIAKDALENLSETHIADIYRSHPSTLSPQFLSVRTTDARINHKFDEIDLKTGTWAKIDPSGYFPT